MPYCMYTGGSIAHPRVWQRTRITVLRAWTPHRQNATLGPLQERRWLMTQVREAYRWRTSDLDRLPDTPWLRYEIINGELIVSRRPHLQHSEIIVRLVVLLYPIVHASGGKVLAE